MFVSRDIKSKRKPKPNILRRKPALNKSLIVHTLDKPESQGVQSLLTSSFVLDPKTNGLEKQKSLNYAESDYSIEKSVDNRDNVTLDICNTQEGGGNISSHNSVIYFDTIQQNDIEFSQNQSLNVEPFLLGDMINQNVPAFENDTLQNKDIEIQAKHKWCLNFIQDPETIIIKHIDDTKSKSGIKGYVEQKPVVPMIPKSEQSSVQEPESSEQVSQHEFVTPLNHSQLSINKLSRISVKFKCEIPDCNKEFMSKQKLTKHISVHNKDKDAKPQRQVNVECPVKRVHELGVEEPCGRIFHIREELMKHLNEEHTIEEALYSCSECGRRFFWASGLRAHARAHGAAARAQLACPWPGCERVFRQPCRLREHARAHTGDRPYPCSFPNCGWSFRTASKLLRHARRHTGERRHACAACGRAFLRREHLRDHAQRHAAPKRRAKHACPSGDCQQSFTNMSSLYMHMKKVHKNEDNVPPAAVTAADKHEKTRIKTDKMFMVSLLEPSETTEIEHATVEVDTMVGALQEEMGEVGEIEEVGEVGEVEEEGHSARTHCTWPLPTRAQHYQPSDSYVLEEDVQVEQSEGTESNIYTVRSDLFLHGNVLHNEDSEQMSQCARVSEGEGEGEGEGEVSVARTDALALDADLLLDAPSVHFDQEELYTDAVDESSFRVFLLSGEELV